MRINELILEDTELDEISARGVGQGIGKVAGNVVRGTSDFFSGIKQGYQQGRAGAQPAASASAPAASGSAQPAASASAQPASGSAQPAASASAQPAASASAPAISVGQINKIIPTLRTRDLQSIKKNVDAIIAKKGSSKQASSAPAAPISSPNLQVQQGGRPKQTAALLRPPATAAVPESLYYSKFLNMKI